MVRPTSPVAAHLGNKVHQVHARLVGLCVRQLEEGGHPEANSVAAVATLYNIKTVIWLINMTVTVIIRSGTILSLN